MKHKLTFFALLCLTVVCKAQVQLPDIKFQDFAEGFNVPLDIENCGDSRLFIVEQPGKIWILDANGNKSSVPFLDITAEVMYDFAEEGLLGLAFDPQYAENGRFYVNYIGLDDSTHIARFNVSANDSNIADPTSEQTVLKIPNLYPNHNSGCLKFGHDNYLYIGTGDGGSAGDPHNRAQKIKTLLGKMLRIDVSELPYSIPPTNPGVNTPVRPEIWAMGLRNPWRFSFDRMTHDLWIGDVGQDTWEEIDHQPASSDGGENYGWSCYEGYQIFDSTRCKYNNVTFPVATYTHDESGEFFCGGTVIGGFVYRGSQFNKMYGKYFTIDYCTGAIRTIYEDNGSWQTTLLSYDEAGYVSFGEDMDGELYVASNIEGEIYKVVDSSVLRLGTFDAVLDANTFPNPNNGSFTLQWYSASAQSCEVSVMNLLGETIMTDKRGAESGWNSWSFSMNNANPGTYMLVIHSSDGFKKSKFVVE